MLKKKYLGLIIACTFFLGIILPNGIKAAEVEEHTATDELVTHINLSNEDRVKMIELGFTDIELDTMTQEEFSKYGDLDGKLTKKDNRYYRIISDLEGNILSSTEVSEKTALIQSSNSSITPFASDTETTSWMSMTTTSSKLTNGNTLLKNSFQWLKSPEIGLTDVLAISHSASAVKVPGTEYFISKYTDGRGEHNQSATSTTKNEVGIAHKFDLKKIGSNAAPSNHHGYMSFQVKKGNSNDIRANAYGHYTHVTVGITGTIDIRTGHINIGGTLTSSKMNDTMILFNY